MDCRLLSRPLVDLLAPTPQAYAPLAFLSSVRSQETIRSPIQRATLTVTASPQRAYRLASEHLQDRDTSTGRETPEASRTPPESAASPTTRLSPPSPLGLECP